MRNYSGFYQGLWLLYGITRNNLLQQYLSECSVKMKPSKIKALKRKFISITHFIIYHDQNIKKSFFVIVLTLTFSMMDFSLEFSVIRSSLRSSVIMFSLGFSVVGSSLDLSLIGSSLGPQ